MAAHKPTSAARINQIKKTYLQTRSMAKTAKVHNCSVYTVRKHRDNEGWLSKAEIAKHGGVRPSTLTNKIATDLRMYWQLGIEDAVAAQLARITLPQLYNWLSGNATATVVYYTQDAAGKKEPHSETIGLRELRTRALSGKKARYLQRLHVNLEKMEGDKQWYAAAKIILRLLEVQWPKEYGRTALNVNVNQEFNETNVTHNTMTIDQLDFTLEERKFFLGKIRERRKIVESQEKEK